MRLDVQYACDEPYLPSKKLLTTWVQTTLENSLLETTLLPQISSDNIELTIRIVDEQEGCYLNETWRQKLGATNVLSFPFEQLPGVELELLGDIVICAPVVARESTEQQKPFLAHWAHLVIHGTLHLLGYNHLDETTAEQMENLEIKILRHLGYPNPYLPTETT
jgi:probable rRNA maturation factor